MFHQIQSFVNEKITKTTKTNKNSRHNFYIYVGKSTPDTVLDINISKEDFVKILETFSNSSTLKNSSFSKEKVYFINNTYHILKDNKIQSNIINSVDYKHIDNTISIIYKLEKIIPNKNFNSYNSYNHIENRETIKIRYKSIEIYLNHILQDNKNTESYTIYFKFNNENYSESILNLIDIMKLLDL